MQTSAQFTPFDWAIVGAYIAVLAVAGWLSTRRQRSADDYFLAGHAIAVSMIVFTDIAASHVLAASALLVILGIVFTYVGGLRSVIWSDLVQVVLYVGAALTVLVILWSSIPASTGEIVSTLAAENKLRLLDFS